MKPLTANRGLPFPVRWPNLDLKVSIIHDARHLGMRLRTDGIKAMSRGFPGGIQVINFSNTRNRSRVCLFLTTENEQLFFI